VDLRRRFFSSETDNLRLAYFFNVQHRNFSPTVFIVRFGLQWMEANFGADPFLKMRRDQWHGKTRSNKSIAYLLAAEETD